ncbi:hypothetical protein EX30DRAFT_372854 [Ascodesmis nigricans]|uniref:Uncharacterized protein n=1 Tax=Ascodesmis nigricans TaxID=341454 RepID=A0A4S2MQS2_9PEZI|nr:hypothetical protein EX30DRAFT_372854 [Ascodesmis nigricans]
MEKPSSSSGAKLSSSSATTPASGSAALPKRATPSSAPAALKPANPSPGFAAAPKDDKAKPAVPEVPVMPPSISGSVPPSALADSTKTKEPDP